MRISKEREDPDYDHSAMARVARVTVDGEDLGVFWLTADEERGLVLCIQTDERGFAMLKTGGGAQTLATHWRPGVVKVEMKSA